MARTTPSTYNAEFVPPDQVDPIVYSRTKFKLTWGKITVTLVGKDQYGLRCVRIAQGRAEPVYLRFRDRSVEIIKDGKVIG